MATLTDAEKIKLRNAVERKANALGIPQRWVKACLHGTVQAIEDVLDGAAVRTAVSGAIDTAAAPYGVTFTTPEKKFIVALVMQIKYARDIV